jgi:phospholipid/cholesterol/gamma-HCH transport system permease protein
MPADSSSPGADTRLSLDLSATPPVLRLRGVWTLMLGVPDPAGVLARLKGGSDLAVDGRGIERWDTSIAAFLRGLERAVEGGGGRLHTEALPAGTDRLMRLIRTSTAPERPAERRPGRLARIGMQAQHAVVRVQAWLALAGMTFQSTLRLATRRARVPFADILDQLVECGPRALPIITLLSFLIGGIMAFVGVVQLRMFGAEIYVADLVGMGMLLEMGALMTAIIMAGRAGAAFAAALGTMQTNEEVDALQTLGFDPVEFLVMPRVLALTVMTPLLTIYADILGILGGAFVGTTMLDLSTTTYFVQTASAIHFTDAARGLIKSTAFGALIAFAGCLRGIECGRSAQEVGRSTTSAVVTAIVLIVLADAFITVLYFTYDGEL